MKIQKYTFPKRVNNLLISVDNILIKLKKCGKLSIQNLHNSVILAQNRAKTGISGVLKAIFEVKIHNGIVYKGFLSSNFPHRKSVFLFLRVFAL